MSRGGREGLKDHYWHGCHAPAQVQTVPLQQNLAGATYFSGQGRMAIRQGLPEYALSGDM